MVTVGELLQAKGHEHWSVTVNTSVYEAISLMAEKNVGALLVLDAGRLVGVLSERDYARDIVLKGRPSKGTPVKEIMSEELVCVSPRQSMEECIVLMTKNHIRHLPVLDEDELVGVISIGDLIKTIRSRPL